MRRVAINLALNHRRPPTPSPLDDLAGPSTPAADAGLAVRLDLRAHVSRLPRQQRAAVRGLLRGPAHLARRPPPGLLHQHGAGHSTTPVEPSPSA